MPDYTFKCYKCNNIMIKHMDMTAFVIPDCTCCGVKMNQVFEPTSFVIKGYTSANNYSKDENGWMDKKIVK